MIRVTFEAEDVQRLRQQIELFLEGPRPSLKERMAARGNEKTLAEATPKKAKAPEPVELIEDAMDLPEEEFVKPETKAAIDLQVLKNEQLDRLRDLFNAGKGTFVRELLSKYGEGAKVFPEVDAKHFPAIKVEIDKELN